MHTIQPYLRHPEQIDAEAVRLLRDEIFKYPYFQAARMLYVRGLYQLQDEAFGEELRRAAVCIPDRTALFELIEGPEMRPKRDVRRRDTIVAHPKTQDTEPADRTQSLIESFLADRPDPTRVHKQHPVDAGTDYIAYLMQQEDSDHAVSPVTERKDEPETPPRQEHLPLSDKKTPVSPSSETQKTDEEAFLTETLARIYIKQGKYMRAIEIIRRISLRNPKKNRYFADQIRFLEKLIANEQAKTEEITNNK